MTALSLNPTQLAILKMFESHKSEEDLKRLKKVLVNYLFDCAIAEADRVWEERGYTAETVEQWKHEHMRVNVEELKKQKENESRH
jgi:hypothetical protein